jgi:hypothetical protein
VNVYELQIELVRCGTLSQSDIDGKWGPKTRLATLAALSNGPDTLCTEADFQAAATELGCDPVKVRVIHEVESSGNPFVDGRPSILPEPHRFSRATGHQYDASHPTISSLKWNKALYPKTQAARWEMLLDMVALNVDAGFASASYGGFQILGENFKRCGFYSPWAFALAESTSEGYQLRAFVQFIKGDLNLWTALRRGDWVTVAKLYNGSAYSLNRYDVRLAQAERALLRSTGA